MNFTLDSQNRPLVSILNEKNGGIVSHLETKAHCKTNIIGDFSGICNGFFSSISLFLRVISSIL